MRRLVTSLSILALALSACGAEEEGSIRHAESEGIAVNSGPLQYKVQISRVLNPSDQEDRAYVAGIADPLERTVDQEEGEEWFGVFLRVRNRSEDATAIASEELRIEDTVGNVFEPVDVDPQLNPLAYEGRELRPGDELPGQNEIARESSTQGALVLFKIPRENLENRPLVLHIEGPGQEVEINLDV